MEILENFLLKTYKAKSLGYFACCIYQWTSTKIVPILTPGVKLTFTQGSLDFTLSYIGKFKKILRTTRPRAQTFGMQHLLVDLYRILSILYHMSIGRHHFKTPPSLLLNFLSLFLAHLSETRPFTITKMTSSLKPVCQIC